ncbi:MAG: hypothetical protein KAI40_10775 [Desulfobacterales bacterium]|nr:hypothetical protein [Desulfobacterales bacterium]
MTKRNKLLQKWKTNTPTTERRNKVESILDYYFPRQYAFVKGGSSHIVINSEKIKNFQDLTFNGTFTIPVSKGGHHIKKHYIKKLIKLLERIEEEERL